MVRAFLLLGVLTVAPLASAFGQDASAEDDPLVSTSRHGTTVLLELLVADLRSLDDAGYRPMVIVATGLAAQDAAVTLQTEHPDLDLRVARTYLLQSTPEWVEERIHREGARCGVWLRGRAKSLRAQLLGECAADLGWAAVLQLDALVPEPEASNAPAAESDSVHGEADQRGVNRPEPVEPLVLEITLTRSHVPIVIIPVGTPAVLKLEHADAGTDGYAGRGGPVGLVVEPDGRALFTPTGEQAGGSWVVEVKRRGSSIGFFQVEVPQVGTAEPVVTNGEAGAATPPARGDVNGLIARGGLGLGAGADMGRLYLMAEIEHRFAGHFSAGVRGQALLYVSLDEGFAIYSAGPSVSTILGRPGSTARAVLVAHLAVGGFDNDPDILLQGQVGAGALIEPRGVSLSLVARLHRDLFPDWLRGTSLLVEVGLGIGPISLQKRQPSSWGSRMPPRTPGSTSRRSRTPLRPGPHAPVPKEAPSAEVRVVPTWSILTPPVPEPANAL
jgi:hypothetical protein